MVGLAPVEQGLHSRPDGLPSTIEAVASGHLSDSARERSQPAVAPMLWRCASSGAPPRCRYPRCHRR
eukprot:6369679-Alexandrium_andersonii.AAC.2